MYFKILQGGPYSWLTVKDVSDDHWEGKKIKEKRRNVVQDTVDATHWALVRTAAQRDAVQNASKTAQANAAQLFGQSADSKESSGSTRSKRERLKVRLKTFLAFFSALMALFFFFLIFFFLIASVCA